MVMTKSEAFKVIELVSSVYDMKFNDIKFDTWLEQLTEYGEYEGTLLKAKQHISRSKFKPTISEILKIQTKKAESVTVPEEETHVYKMKHDSEYASQHRKLKERWEQLKREWAEEDE